MSGMTQSTDAVHHIVIRGSNRPTTRRVVLRLVALVIAVCLGCLLAASFLALARRQRTLTLSNSVDLYGNSKYGQKVVLSDRIRDGVNALSQIAAAWNDIANSDGQLAMTTPDVERLPICPRRTEPSDQPGDASAYEDVYISSRPITDFGKITLINTIKKHRPTIITSIIQDEHDSRQHIPAVYHLDLAPLWDQLEWPWSVKQWERVVADVHEALVVARELTDSKSALLEYDFSLATELAEKTLGEGEVTVQDGVVAVKGAKDIVTVGDVMLSQLGRRWTEVLFVVKRNGRQLGINENVMDGDRVEVLGADLPTRANFLSTIENLADFALSKEGRAIMRVWNDNQGTFKPGIIKESGERLPLRTLCGEASELYALKGEKVDNLCARLIKDKVFGDVPYVVVIVGKGGDKEVTRNDRIVASFLTEDHIKSWAGDERRACYNQLPTILARIYDKPSGEKAK